MVRRLYRGLLQGISFLLVISLFHSCSNTQESSSHGASHQPITNIKDTAKGSNMENEVPAPEEVLYVLASSGLNLRTTSDPKSKVLTNMPYGSSVNKRSKSNHGPTLTVENLEGHMIEVEFEGQIGFAFSGFLSPIPPPEGTPTDKYQYVRDYIASLEKQGFQASLQEAKTEESRLSVDLPLVDFNAGFLTMRRLFSVPNSYNLPELGKSISYSTPESPSQEAIDGPYDYVTQSVTYTGTPSKGIKEIIYYDDNEVGGRDITITALDDAEGGVRINLRNWSH